MIGDRLHTTTYARSRVYISPDRDLLPAPTCFGDLFPPRYTDWRPDQADAVLAATESSERFVGLAAPTGFGKSLAYVGAAQISGLRVAILTSTKGLQEQLLRDFNADGQRRLYDVRGQNAYRCVAATDFGMPEHTTVDHAPCHSGKVCSRRHTDCLYYTAIREAREARVVLTNYAFWLSSHAYADGLGKFDILVMDEAHDVPDTLAGFMQIELDNDDLRPLAKSLPDPGWDMRQWQEWAVYLLPAAQLSLERIQGVIRSSGSTPASVLKDSYVLKRLVGKLEQMTHLGDDWVKERVPKRPSGFRMQFDPLWPYSHAERLLFLGIPKVVFMSATIRPKTMHLLGVNPDNLLFREYRSTFPTRRRPISHIPTVQINRNTAPENKVIWIKRMDAIMSPRVHLGRKGIIHSVSFARAKEIKSSSAFGHLMTINESNNTKWVVEEFKRQPGPRILISPSLSTGWDFPDDECRWQIVAKLPFPDNRAEVIKARMKADPEYSDYVTMQNLIQMCGRGMRSASDWCETFIVDDSIGWFMQRNGKRFAPQWFIDAVVWAKSIPPPMAEAG